MAKFTFYLCVLACLYSEGFLYGDGIQLNGTVIREWYAHNQGSGGDPEKYTNTFSLSLYGNKWKCKTSWGQYSELMAYDGTNTYIQRQYPPPSAGPIYANSEKVTTGAARSGPSCVDGVNTTRVLWIAFCGGPSFNGASPWEGGHTNPIIIPWGIPSLIGSEAMDYKVEWLDSAHWFPKNVKFLMSDVFYKKEIVEKGLDASGAPYRDGDVTGEYNVSGSQSIGEYNIPKKFECVHYMPTFWHRMEAYERWTGEVSEVHMMDDSWSLPPLRMLTCIADFRFASAKRKWLEVMYHAPAGAWPGTNDPVVTSNLESAIKDYPQAEKRMYGRLKPDTDPK